MLQEPAPTGTPSSSTSRSDRPTSERGWPSTSQFYDTNRGGGLYSEAVSQRIGAVFAAAAHRIGLPPTALTIANLLLAIAASVAAPRYGWVALIGWQLAYALDCADGQLARVTNRTSPAGARVDVLCDVAAQIALVAALAAVAVEHKPGTPTWLVATFAGTWMVNLVTSVLQSGPQAASMVPSRSVPVRLVKLIRDYGAVVAAAGLVITFVPEWTVVLLVAFSIVNGGFLLASIAFSARASLK